jgi:arginine deiminase
MRDPAVVVRDAAVSCKMHYRERVRESVLVRAVLENHPEFRDNAITYGGSAEPTEDRPHTIEGGDVIILSPDAVLVGASERTRSETIELLADKCFRVGHVRRVYEVPIPAERSFMHLDTVFTVIDRGMVLWYAPVMERIPYIHRYERVDESGGKTVRRFPEDRSLPDILRAEFESDLTIIDTAGGHSHFGKREQRNDATNALAIAPRVAITYERNERTIRALEDHGVTCIGIDDSELVRGLGGPRCMTMPLRREPV